MPTGAANEDWGANVALSAPDGSDRRLLLPAANEGDRFAGLRSPHYSPDGARTAFGAVEAASANLPTPICRSGFRWPWQPRIAAAHGPPIDIWAMPADGGEPDKVSDLNADDPSVTWSPDGGTLAIIATCGLYLLPATGGGARKIGPGAAQLQIDWR